MVRPFVEFFDGVFDDKGARRNPRIAESEGWCPGGGYNIAGGVGIICSGGDFLGGRLDILDGMVGYQWLEFSTALGKGVPLPDILLLYVHST